MIEGLKFSRVLSTIVLIYHSQVALNLYSNLGMARLSPFMGPFGIWGRHRNLCTVRTHLVTRYYIIQQVSIYFLYNSQFGFFLAGLRDKKEKLLGPRAKKML